MATKRLSKARQLAGPGIPGTSTDTPLYHLDIDRDELPELVADPVKYLAKAGLGAEQGIAPGGAMSVSLGRGDLRWTTDGWQQVDDSESTGGWCCFVVGDQTICHNH